MMSHEEKNEELKNNPYFLALVDWRCKMKFLEKQIKVLEKLDKFPIMPISAFILKSQLIEFRLKQLLTSLDLYLALFDKIHHKVRKIRNITPKKINEMKWTFGRLIVEIKKHKISFLEELVNGLEKLKKIRNKFVHEIFDTGSLDQLINEAENGLKLTSDVISEIDSVEKIMEAEYKN